MASSVESVAKLICGATGAGVEIINLIDVEDVMIRENDTVCGLVINWGGAVSMTRLHVDPLAVRAKVVIDGTGHDAGICSTVQRKIPGAKLEKGGVGEKPMWADVGERLLMETAKEVYPGLIFTGMAANAVAGAPWMGAVFGGMMMSGKKAAEIAIEKLKKHNDI